MVEKSLFDEEPLQWSSEEAVPREPGVYAIFLSGIRNTPESWRADLWHKRNLLYIGKGGTGLRNSLSQHFAVKDSSYSTFRKSVGAMLRTTLNLKPIYRTEGHQKEGRYSFRQEELLSKWIQEHCAFTFLCVHSEYTEKTGYELIKIHNPPLNIVDNEQFCHPKLRGARNECVELAKNNLNIREYAIDRFPCNVLRHCWNSGANIPNEKGLVAIFLKEGEEHEQAVPQEWRKGLIRANRLLYIGLSRNLRQYLEFNFAYNDKGITTFQQMLYVMLCPSIGASAKEQYHLDDVKLLLSWMWEHCAFAYCECEEEVEKKKKELIKQYTPPLNRSDNPRPHPLLKGYMK